MNIATDRRFEYEFAQLAVEKTCEMWGFEPCWRRALDGCDLLDVFAGDERIAVCDWNVQEPAESADGLSRLLAWLNLLMPAREM